MGWRDGRAVAGTSGNLETWIWRRRGGASRVAGSRGWSRRVETAREGAARRGGGSGARRGGGTTASSGRQLGHLDTNRKRRTSSISAVRVGSTSTIMSRAHTARARHPRLACRPCRVRLDSTEAEDASQLSGGRSARVARPRGPSWVATWERCAFRAGSRRRRSARRRNSAR